MTKHIYPTEQFVFLSDLLQCHTTVTSNKHVILNEVFTKPQYTGSVTELHLNEEWVKYSGKSPN